jgi:hypothetical protein
MPRKNLPMFDSVRRIVPSGSKIDSLLFEIAMVPATLVSHYRGYDLTEQDRIGKALTWTGREPDVKSFRPFPQSRARSLRSGNINGHHENWAVKSSTFELLLEQRLFRLWGRMSRHFQSSQQGVTA